MTSSLLFVEKSPAMSALNPRAVIAQEWALIRATCTPGAMRKTSGMQVAPERRIISGVMTNTAAGERPTVLC